MSALDTTGRDNRSQLLEMINANWMTNCIGAAASLELPERLEKSPQCAEDLAAGCNCHAPSLARLLRALCSLGLCNQGDDGRFELTPLGALLCMNAKDSLRATVHLRAAQAPAWNELALSVRTGKSWRVRNRGRDDFSHLDADPRAAALFHRAMVELTQRVADDVSSVACIKDDDRLIVDVGGGSGGLLEPILHVHPALRGIIFDLEHAREGAAQRLAATGLSERCQFVAGTFFDSVPAGGDVYLLKSVLHNWDDEGCTRILASCRAAMSPSARLLIVERIAPERLSDRLEHRRIAASDLSMLVSLNGKERCEFEFGELFRAASMTVSRITPIGGDLQVIECTVG